MNEQIEKDKHFLSEFLLKTKSPLKNSQNVIYFHSPDDFSSFNKNLSLYLLQNKKSYIPHLIKNNKILLQNKKSIKLSKMSTLNIFFYLEEAFSKNDRFVFLNISFIITELKSRHDLFLSSLEFIKNRNVKDDLYYWVPHYKINNVFSLIQNIVPDFIFLFKNYLIKSLILNKTYVNSFNFIKERFSNEIEDLEIIIKDFVKFKDLITLPYWVPQHENLKLEEKNTLKTKELAIERVFDYSDDIYGVLVPQVSYIDFDINNRNFVVTLDKYLGLFNKEEKHKEFWIKEKLIDENWEIL